MNNFARLVGVWTLLGLHLLAASPGAREIRAGRVDAAPRIDGRLDEAVWAGAEFDSGFVQRDPVEGVEPPTQTEVAFLYDEGALYVGARMHSADAGAIRALLTRRDRETSSEQLVVSLDTFRDRRTAYSFGVTAAGVRLDYYHPDDEDERDYAFDPVWEAAARKSASGWVAEMRIPFSQLRFNESPQQVWGLNIRRLVPAQNREDFWLLIPKDEAGWASHFGRLAGLKKIAPPPGIEFFPYTSGSATHRSRVEEDNPFSAKEDLGGQVGADLKVHLGSDLTLDTTFNPDFGQVEADPAEVNLSQFETFLRERRPFFTEGSRFLGVGSRARLFYSRRVGGPPHGGAAGDFVEQPEQTTILGAAKLTGRTPSGLSIGALTALTQAEYARTWEAASARFGRAKVEPLSLYGVLRGQQEFGAHQSTAGLMLTAVHRDMEEDEPLARQLNRRAYSGRGEFALRFAGGRYAVDGFVAFSLLHGEEGALARVQRSSAQYFQRPDAGHVEFDSTRTWLGGYAFLVQFKKRGGEHWLWEVAGRMESPGLNFNDLGMTFTSDDIETWAKLIYRENAPSRLFQNYWISLRLFPKWNYGWAHDSSEAELSVFHTWRNFMRSALEVEAQTRGSSDRATRGGPLMGSPAAFNAEFSLGSNAALKTSWEVELAFEADENAGRGWEVEGELTLRPSDQWELAVEPGLRRDLNTRQYITSRAGGRLQTFGRRYIFATVKRSEISTQFRLNYALHPDLSLQAYMEPFAAAGRFYDFGELALPRQRHLRHYDAVERTAAGDWKVVDGAASFALANPDFNKRSWRSTTVLRWEWRGGSTLFFIWQQDRAAVEEHGQQVGPGALWEGWNALGKNVFGIKLRYWLPLE